MMRDGRGIITLRARAEVIALSSSREQIIINEIPYQVNKATLIEKIAKLVQIKKIEGITEIRDESNREGMRIVIELKRNTNTQIILKQLYAYTSLQVSFGANILVLHQGKPEQMGILQIIRAFVSFREDITRKKNILPLAEGKS